MAKKGNTIFKKSIRWCKTIFSFRLRQFLHFSCLMEIVQSNHFRRTSFNKFNFFVPHILELYTKTEHAHSLKGNKIKHLLLLEHIYQMEPLYQNPSICVSFVLLNYTTAAPFYMERIYYHSAIINSP